jgi:hypothetical protein
MYANPIAPVTIGSDAIALPGYNPFTPGSGGAFGGPQNMLQVLDDTSWSQGSHTLRFGGSYDYLRDKRTDTAFQTAVGSLSAGGGIGPALNDLLLGRFTQTEVAVQPCGATPGCSLTLPASAPGFSRSNRFHEGALYAPDFWKPRRRPAINLGVRWEHFGVQHNSNPNLDSNWGAPGIGFADDNLGAYLRAGGLQVASKNSVGGLRKPDCKDFAPRIGIAWDVFGDATTTVRGGRHSEPSELCRSGCARAGEHEQPRAPGRHGLVRGLDYALEYSGSGGRQPVQHLLSESVWFR